MLGRCAKFFTVALVAGFALSLPYDTTPAEAGAKKRTAKSYRAAPKVRGDRRRIGGYSYSYSDSIIDFRDRSVFLDPNLDQKPAGPFDSGFFFESGVERHNSTPYLY